MRLAAIDSNSAAFDVQLGHDGNDIALEDSGGGKRRRYIHGPGVDEPLMSSLVNGASTFRDYYHADERGSIVSISDLNGAAGTVGKYDEYGAGIGISHFQYAGQYWLVAGEIYYSRARNYNPKLGRFLQPDPIGHGGGMNMYAYVGGDPVNFTDPSGLQAELTGGTIYVTGERPTPLFGLGPLWSSHSRYDGKYMANMVNMENGGGTTCAPGDPSCEITITGERPVRDLRNCEADFAGRQFTLGMSWDLRNVQFRYGRDSSTNISSQKALDTGAGAVTQYSVIYVNPDSWARITNPNNSAFWEEVASGGY